MKNVSQKSIDTLQNMLSRSSMQTYPDNLQRKGAPLTEEQRTVFLSDDHKQRYTATIEILSTPEVTEKANALSNGNHKPGNAFSQYDYDTIISFISDHELYASRNSHHKKDLLAIKNSVKAAKSEASPKGLISTIRLYELLKAAHYHNYRVEMNRGSRYQSLIDVEQAKEWVKFHRDISNDEELVAFQRDDLLEILQLSAISIQDTKAILDRIVSSKLISDDGAQELVTYILENQPHELKNFTEYGGYNKNLAIAQINEEQGIIEEHRQIAFPLTFILTFSVLLVLLGGLSIASFISTSLDGIDFIDTILDTVKGWHLAIVEVTAFLGFLGVSESKLSRKKKQVDAVGAQKYYSESEDHRRRRFKKVKRFTQSKAIASKTLVGRGYDIALTSYKGSNLSLSSGSLAYDAITSGGFLKGAFNRVYCENSANFHNVLVHALSNAAQTKNALIITNTEHQYLAKYDTNPNTEVIELTSLEYDVQNIHSRLEDGYLGVIIVDKMSGVETVQIEKALYDKYEIIQEQNIPVIILQNPIEDDEDFKNATLNDIADQIVEVYAGSLDDKDDKDMMFMNVVENTLTALTEEVSTVQFQENTSKTLEVLELGAKMGFLDKYDDTTWIDIQTGYQIDGDTVEEAEARFALNKELYHAISNKVCRLILDPSSEAIEAPDNRMIAHYEPKAKPKVINAPSSTGQQIQSNEQQKAISTKTEVTQEPVISFSTVKEQYDEIVDTIMSYEMDISKAIQFPAFNDPAVPAVQEMQIQLRKTKRLIDQYKSTQQGDMNEIVDNVDILHVRLQAAEATAKKIAWDDVTHEEREDMKLAQNLINQISSPGNPEHMRKNLYVKLKEVVTRLNKRHEIIPTDLVLELEKTSALALPSAG